MNGKSYQNKTSRDNTQETSLLPIKITKFYMSYYSILRLCVPQFHLGQLKVQCAKLNTNIALFFNRTFFLKL
jgi:hypothetical protein